MGQILAISLCRYQNGSFDLFIGDPEGDGAICISGTQEFTAAEIDFADRVMPACVMTNYAQVQGKPR